MNPGIGRIVGKTIASVVVSEGNTGGPPAQVFLIFDDGTAYELYGDIHATSRLETRGEGAVLRYATLFGGRITRFTGVMRSCWSIRDVIERLDIHRS
ncbi:MAG: hypothetical protein M5U01_43325 [Ardenticatenaceae bacterium]|nr:hypothetical protein [Ardenticatenaceae bacterium]HBY94009.1 hypothetical protein [Chloroflexota bacterium]